MSAEISKNFSYNLIYNTMEMIIERNLNGDFILEVTDDNVTDGEDNVVLKFDLSKDAIEKIIEFFTLAKGM